MTLRPEPEIQYEVMHIKASLAYKNRPQRSEGVIDSLSKDEAEPSRRTHQRKKVEKSTKA